MSSNDQSSINLKCNNCQATITHQYHKRAKTGNRFFGVHSCLECKGLTAKCEDCDYTESFSGWKVPCNVRRRMKKHIDKCENNSNAMDPLAGDVTNNDAVADACRNGVDSCQHSCGSEVTMENNASEFHVFAEMSESEDILSESLTPSCVTHDGYTLASYGVSSTDRYISMEIEMYHQHHESLGGYRSACWR